MVPPIFQCENDHSICFSCRSQIQKCPNCKGSFNETENFSLPQIMNKLKHCNFFTKPTCIHKKFSCPLKGYVACEELINCADVLEHIKAKHYEHLVSFGNITYPFRGDIIEHSAILRYDNKLFQMHFAYKNQIFYWHVQLIADVGEECEKYRFEVDIQDNTLSNCKFYLKGKCGQLTSKAQLQNLATFTFLNYKQIYNLINTHLTFDIRIVKCQ